MVSVRNQLRFLLNDQAVVLETVSSDATLLDYLRLQQRLRGTKEGCAEGDCGACTVLVGRLKGDALVYETVNSCIRFVGSLDGCHVVTIEHLKKADGTLHPVQQAMVDEHGSQCGFCTPGFVMSLYALWMSNLSPSNHDIETALQGNLCRCTGYEPIIIAAQKAVAMGGVKNDPLVVERQAIKDQLADLKDGARVEIESGGDCLFVPSSLDDLADIRKVHPSSTLVAGATDVGLWVTKHMRSISPVIFIGHLDELHEITVSQDGLTIGACVTYTEMQPSIQKHFPQLAECWNRIGGEQVRNMGTIGGNIANGSPIGDTPPAFIALGASITLGCGGERRTMLLEDFFIDYGKQDRQAGDFVESITLPFVDEGDAYAVYKISKRRNEDISTVCGAFRLKINDGMVENAVIAFGGMAATPKRASNVEAKLKGQSWSEQTVASAMASFGDDFSPLSDWRGSSDYRALVAKNLLRRFYLETEASHGGDTRLPREAIG